MAMGPGFNPEFVEALEQVVLSCWRHWLYFDRRYW